ncbi:hypothetical protein [uncultured Cetobacterium sp.]|uniref:hypothetical protein n=1 Tax=uncultured Cetobacterium sp. TaxID=527638 RepID=UPI00261E6F2E|nr:hypothetical protein [uncultured Cetobacterium sp.]
MVKSKEIKHLNLKGSLDFPFKTKKCLIKKGIYNGGEILQKAVDGTLELLVAGGNPYGILFQAYEGENDFNGVVYLTGTFDSKALIIPQNEKIETYEDKLRSLSIFLVY